ncbi:MAG: MauE/DoxX family redox-associated membrane protein [Terrimicrobiaceae bacterium]|nr:MauE/DoxX family redox-associated membrane protein [Terrimicrobiaceae bacterium]
MKWIARAIRWALAGIFLYAGLIKAGASEQFSLAILPFTFVPPGWTGSLAIALAAVEILAGVLLLLPRVHIAGSAMVIALCLVFIGALGWALANGIVVDCGCFGRDESPSVEKMVVALLRDVVILAAAGFTLWMGSMHLVLSTDPKSR